MDSEVYSILPSALLCALKAWEGWGNCTRMERRGYCDEAGRTFPKLTAALSSQLPQHSNTPQGNTGKAHQLLLLGKFTSWKTEAIVVATHSIDIFSRHIYFLWD